MRFTATGTIGGTLAQISQVDFGYDNWPIPGKTSVKQNTLAPLSEMPRVARAGMVEYLGKAGTSPLGLNGFANSRTITYYSIDGKKLYQQSGGVPVLPAGFGSKACIVQEK